MYFDVYFTDGTSKRVTAVNVPDAEFRARMDSPWKTVSHTHYHFDEPQKPRFPQQCHHSWIETNMVNTRYCRICGAFDSINGESITST